jgi:hypothetical protein
VGCGRRERRRHRLPDGAGVMLARIVPGVLAMLLLVACGSGSNWQAKPEQHIVRKGETLFSIAWRYGKDPTDVARWNRLGDGSLIYPGQVIRLTPPSGDRQRSASTRSSRQPLPSIPAQPPPAWGWPTRGQLADPGPDQGRIRRETGKWNRRPDRRPVRASHCCRGLRQSCVCGRWTDRLRSAYYSQT